MYILDCINAQDFNEEIITILWIFNDFWHILSYTYTSCNTMQNFHLMINDYITWPCSWISNLSHMFSLLACVSHRNYVIFSLGIKGDNPDKMSHAKYGG